MAHLLNFYSLTLKQVASHHMTGCCPIHNGDNPNAFHVDLEKNLFNCFTQCGGGSIFDFVMKKEKISFYQAASKIWNSFYSTGNSNPKAKRDFSIRLQLQANHPYLRKRDISPQLAMFFQLGFCQYGIMKNRIAIPIYDPGNRIVAYCGRAVNNDTSPKYLFPKNFNKSRHLFNIQHIAPQIKKPVFIVEGFFDCIHLGKLGFDALALMGNSISKQQISIIKDINRFYILMLDGDEAGQKAIYKVEQNMKKSKLQFKKVCLGDGKEPEDLDEYSLMVIAAS